MHQICMKEQIQHHNFFNFDAKLASNIMHICQKQHKSRRQLEQIRCQKGAGTKMQKCLVGNRWSFLLMRTGPLTNYFRKVSCKTLKKIYRHYQFDFILFDYSASKFLNEINIDCKFQQLISIKLLFSLLVLPYFCLNYNPQMEKIQAQKNI